MTGGINTPVRPPLGFWRAWALVVGSMMGSSVFLLPALIAPYGGTGQLGLAAAGLGGLAIALMLAELARRLPAAGGPIAYTRAAFGDLAGFLIAWVYWVGALAGCGAIAVAIPGYLAVFVPAISASPAATVASALMAVWVTVAINCWGVREAGIVGLVITLLKLAPLIVIALAGVFWIDWRLMPAWNPSPEPALAALASAFSIGFWNYVGVEAATVPAGDVADPGRTIPRATIAGVLTCIAIYELVALVATGTVPAADLGTSGSPVALVAGRMAGSVGAITVSVAALGSIFAVLHYTVLLAGQAAAAAAHTALFPRFFDRRTRRGTTGTALAVSGLLISALVLMNSSKGLVAAYRFMALISTLAAVIPYALCALAVFTLKWQGEGDRRARSRANAVACFAFLVSVVVAVGAGADVVYWTMVLMLAGLPVYVAVRRTRESTSGRTSEQLR